MAKDKTSDGPKPVKLHPDQYWELRTLMTEARMAEQAAQQLIATAQAKLREKMLALGLKDQTAYRADDATLTVVEVPQA